MAFVVVGGRGGGRKSAVVEEWTIRHVLDGQSQHEE